MSEPWTPEELTIVRDYYPHGLARRCKPLLPGRTVAEIHQAAAELACTTLTRRENAMMCLIAEGDTYQEAAEGMGWTRETVNEMATRVRRKLKARNMAHAVYLAVSRGLIPLDTTDTK